MKSIKILIIDDEADIATTVAFALKRSEYHCDIAHTGQAALAALQAKTYDLLILDVGLPDYDGFALLKHIRSKSAVPVIMLTAHNDEIKRVFGLELGADDYLGKPFSPRELTIRVQNCLQRRASPPSPALFHHDPARAEIHYQQQKLPLTLTETRLFACMLAQPRRIFSREQLLSHAFSDNHPSDPRTIDTHIKTLRHKLRDHHAPDCIITHRALGVVDNSQR